MRELEEARIREVARLELRDGDVVLGSTVVKGGEVRRTEQGL